MHGSVFKDGFRGIVIGNLAQFWFFLCTFFFWKKNSVHIGSIPDHAETFSYLHHRVFCWSYWGGQSVHWSVFETDFCNLADFLCTFFFQRTLGHAETFCMDIKECNADHNEEVRACTEAFSRPVISWRSLRTPGASLIAAVIGFQFWK